MQQDPAKVTARRPPRKGEGGVWGISRKEANLPILPKSEHISGQVEFERIAQAAWDGLPQTFREIAGNLVIQIVDLPLRETLAALGIDHPYGLLGLYHGVGLPFKSVSDIAYGPDMIFLYRLPLIAYARETGEPLQEVITHVLIHEIGHHFGLSDADMEAIEAEAG